MNTDPKTPPTPPALPPVPPVSPDAPSWWKRYGPTVIWLAVTIVTSLLAVLLGVQVAPPPPPVIVETVKEVPAVAGAAGDYAPTFGWLEDEAAITRNLDPTQTAHFDTTPAGKAVLGDEDVFLWRAVRKVNPGQPAQWYPNVNQQNVGCCVGCGWKHCSDVVQATAIVSGSAFEWKPVSVEVIYAGSRIDVGQGRISGDGSVGAWAREYVSRKGGIAAMQKYAAADLSQFSPARAREWGRRGAPAEIKTAAAAHPVKGCALVKSWGDVKRAIQQGYPVAVCSNQGFAMQRDSTGRCRPQGTWPHCMAIIGVRSARDGRGEAGFILNSWGDSAHSGPVWPADMPPAGFWADADVIGRMVGQGDSFALADVAGFPSRKIDWFVAVPRRVPRDRFAHFKREVFLSW